MDGHNSMYNLLMGNAPVNTFSNSYNALGRTFGASPSNKSSNGSDDNFFLKRAKSLENAFGTTGAALYETGGNLLGATIAGLTGGNYESAKSKEQREKQEGAIKDYNEKVKQIYKDAGYQDTNQYEKDKDEAMSKALASVGFDLNDYWNKRGELALNDRYGDSDAIKELDRSYEDAKSRLTGENAENFRKFDEIEQKFRDASNAQSSAVSNNANAYDDYTKNNYASQKINQDRGKFLGSSINTLSTMFDVLAPGAGSSIAANVIQGGLEGVADELEQNGFENYDWGRAGQNALTGATVGAVTGGLNKGISNQLAKNGGNLFKGGNALTRGLNTLGSSTTAGRIGSTLATGAARGAVSGAVGGATGAGLSAAMNGQDVLGSAIQGAQQGFGQGAMAGGIMAGANMAANATPGVGNVMRQLNDAGENWKNSGNTFNERLTNTLTSGDSPVGEWLQGNTRSKALQRAGMIGNTIVDADNQNIKLYRGLSAPDDQTLQKYIDDMKNPNIQPHSNYGGDKGADGYYFTTDKSLAEYYANNSGLPSQAIVEIEAPKDRFTKISKENGNRPVDFDMAAMNRGVPESERYETGVRDFNNYIDSNNYWGSNIDDNNYVIMRNDALRNMALSDNNVAGTPTTLGGWLKQAGKRIVEDANNRGVGLSIKNVAEAETIPQDIQNMKINNPYADGTYKTVPAEEVNVRKTNNSATTPANAENTLKTSKSEQLRYKAAQELLKQYGTVDKPTAKATNAPKTIQEIADAGFTKPGDVERIADNITGSNGEVNKLVQNLVATAKRVNTFDGLDGKTIDEFIDESIARNALDGINEGRAVKSQIKAYLNSLDSRRNGSVDWSDNPEDVMDVVRGLEAEAANYEGRSGMNYGTTTQDKMNAAKVAKDVATLLKDRVFETVDVKSAMTPEVGESLKSLAPGNKEWANYVDNKIMTAKNVQDLRSVQAPFVRAKKIIDNGYMNSVTYGGRLGNSTNAIPTTKTGIVRDVVNNTLNSNIANRAKAKALNKAADIADRFSGNNAGGGDGATGGTVNGLNMALPSGEVSGQTYNPNTSIYDMIGRTEGLSNAEQARTADYLINAAQEAEIVPNNNNNTLESLVSQPTASNGTSVYNSLYGGNNQTQSTTTQAPTTQSANQRFGNSGAMYNNGLSYYPQTGDYWTDIIGIAMTNAINDEDYSTFGALYEMYQSQLANLKKQSSNGKDYSNITNWNSSDRSKLLSAQDAMSQIDQLESAYNTATGGQGGNVLQGNLRSLAANISGGNLDASANNYNKLAESVGMGIVKNLINLGVTESDAKRYLEYLPSLTDTKEQASQKLATLRNIYQSQINNLYSAYGL